MKKTRYNWLTRLIAMTLVIASLAQWLPPKAAAAESSKNLYDPGDVNGDGKINALDVNLIRRYIVGGYGVSIDVLAADVNGDARVNAKDVNNLRRYIAGGYGVDLKPGLEKYTVKFKTGNGTSMADKVVAKGTLLSSLSEPYWAEHIFAGWYYDAALTKPVASTDKVTKNMTLYANWLEQAPLDTLDTVNFVSAVDVATNFTIGVVSADAGMTAHDVLAVITADDLTDPDAKNVISVTGSNGSYTIKSGNGGFKEGASYRITLNSDLLAFKGKEASAREYNFTVHRNEVMNLTMNGDIRYIPVSKVSNMIHEGKNVSSLDLAFYESDGDKLKAAERSAGSFTCPDVTGIKAGDIVCIYDGEIPTNRTKDTPKSKLGDVAYLEITGVNGTTYTYENADPENVIFTPDVLPMPVAADTDDNDSTVTVENKYLDYSGDIYAYINLDSQTTVDVGDFFAFYTGDYGVESGENAAALTGYGKITGVKANGDDTTTITFVQVTWAQVESCMDVYTNEEMSADELLEGVDVAAVEAAIEQQALDSGFVEEAAQYMASLALATDNFSKLSENMNLEDYKVTLTEGELVSPEQLQLMAEGANVKVVEKSVKSRVSKKPTHLGDIAGTNADQKGIAFTLDVKVVLHIYSDYSGDVLEIAILGSFVEELGVDLTAGADAEWDWAVIIPYISDIKVSACVDTINYTGVSFNATMVTKDKNNTSSAMDIANEIKALLSSMAEGGVHSDENQEKLIQKYHKLVSTDTDMVRAVDINIVTVQRNLPLEIPLINLNFTVDFVVEMDAALSVGFDFEYIEGKRHVFTMSIKDRNAYSDSIDLVEKTYQFRFYALGRIKMRVGVEMGFAISVFTPKLGSVGFEAGAGAFTNLYGYFFYELRYTESKGKDVQYSGALLIQVGVYLDFGLVAQALGGRYSARANLFAKEWKLYETGRRDNVLDFDIEQEDVPEIVMKQFVRRVQLPDSFFNMDYLDLITGESAHAIYNDWNDPERDYDFRNGENYVITMTNDKFSYDPTTNTIGIDPDEDDLKITGEMIVTWKKQPMSFSSKAITRTIPLYWDNLRDGYLIVPYTNGGSYVPIIIKNYEQKVTAPQDPVKLGYDFAGWFSDADLTAPYVFPEIMPATDTSIFAKWEPRKDTAYTVEHYQENFKSGEYELVEVENFQGTTDSYVTPAVKSYVGFNAPAQAQLKVYADGSAVLRYYYSLERHNVTFDAGKVDGQEVTAVSDVTYNLKYGAPISAPHMALKGYTFVGWSVNGAAANVASQVGTKDLTYTAMWEKNADTPYRIEYYVQQADGRYTLQHMIKGETVTGKVFTEEYLRSIPIDGDATADQKFLLENAIVFENMTVGGIVCTDAAVDGNGKTVIKINYGRQKHSLTFDPNYPGAEPVVKELFYGAEIIAPQNMTRTGYTFAGWEVEPVQTMPTESLTYRAVWTANTYTVQFDKDHGDAVGTMEPEMFTYDEEKALAANGFTRQHYNFTGWAIQSAGQALYADGESVKNLTADADGQVTLYAAWAPVEYAITYEAQDGIHSNPTSYTVESDTIYLSDAVRTGYTFGGWYDNAAFTGDAVTQITKETAANMTLYAKWIPNSDTAYRVEHHQQQLDGSYIVIDTEYFTGTTDRSVTPQVKSYTGFTAPAVETTTIKADGTLVVTYRYSRNSYTITFDPAGGTMETTSITAKYGEAISYAEPTRDGYGFRGWYIGSTPFVDTTMGAENLTVTAVWEAGKIGYTAKHYQQNVNGEGYTLVQTENGTADMDSQVTLAVNTYEGFTSPEAVTITIAATSAENVREYCYARNIYNLTWDLGIGSAEGQSYTNGTVYYGAPITAPVPVKTGYSYTWSAEPAATMPAGDLSYAASWTANEYKVSFNTNGGNVVSGDATQRVVVFDSAYGELPVMEKSGYTFEGWFDGETEITGETILSKASDHTLTAKFELITYSLTFNGVAAEEHTNPAQYNTETAVAIAAPKGRTGYKFEGWFTSADFSGDAVVKIEKGSTGNMTFYAKWTENIYPVTFHANDGTAAEEIRDIPYTGMFGENPYVREGYTFLGWSDGVSDTIYNGDTPISSVVTDGTQTLHFYAVWQKQRYTITYENVGAGEHQNPTEYTVEDKVSLGDPNGRAGYTFLGWYDNASFEGTPVETITAGSTGHKLFYALWRENSYTVVLNSNDGTGASIITEPILYSGFVPVNTYAREGYTFQGWATTPGGAKVADDAAAISKIAGYANGDKRISLYAVWKLQEYSITYHLGDHAASATHNNPTVYSMASGADIVLKDLTPKSGFQFGGWYTDAAFAGEKVTTIPLQAQKDYTLYAKWEHGGEFSVSQTSVSGYKVTYTVTRTIPAGAVGTAANQNVYVRTQNGTAYGTTTDSYGQDKYHFIHNYAVLPFGPNDTSKTFVVTEKDDKLENYITASYQIGGKTRNYYVEIYKVENTAGGLVGTIGTGRITRTMPLSSYELTTNMYRWISQVVASGPVTITEASYSSHTSYIRDPATIYNGSASSVEEAYRDIVSDKYSYRVSFDAVELYDGYQHFRLSTVDPNGKTTVRGEYIFDIKEDEVATNWRNGLSFPNIGTGKQQDVVFTGGDCEVTESFYTYNDNGVKYAAITAGNRIKMEFNAHGSKSDDWQYRNLTLYVKIHDKSKPALQYAAPLATTAYKQGDTAYITVIYSEPINTISGTPKLTLSSKLSPYFESPTYVNNGTGTNALVFQVKAKKDISADEIQNIINLYLAFPVSGVGGTFTDNVGTLSATVKDILGN